MAVKQPGLFFGARLAGIGDRVRISANSTFYDDWKGWTGFVKGLDVSTAGIVTAAISEHWPPASHGDHTDGWLLEELVLVPEEKSGKPLTFPTDEPSLLDLLRDTQSLHSEGAFPPLTDEDLRDLLLKVPGLRDRIAVDAWRRIAGVMDRVVEIIDEKNATLAERAIHLDLIEVAGTAIEPFVAIARDMEANRPGWYHPGFTFDVGPYKITGAHLIALKALADRFPT